MQEINVFVVDDHQIFLDGIVSLLDDEPNIKIAGTAHNGKVAIDKIKTSKVDVVLMDINMPEMDGIEATKQLRCIASRVLLKNVWKLAQKGMC